MPYIIRTRMVATDLPTPASPPSLDPLRLADLLTSPSLSLSAVATELGVSFADLLAFLTSPEGESLVHSLTTLHTQRARLAAVALLPKVLTTVNHTLTRYDNHIKAGTATDTHHDRARKSCTLLLRLANRRATPLPSLFPSSPSPSSPPRLSVPLPPLRDPPSSPGSTQHQSRGLQSAHEHPTRPDRAAPHPLLLLCVPPPPLFPSAICLSPAPGTQHSSRARARTRRYPPLRPPRRAHRLPDLAAGRQTSPGGSSPAPILTRHVSPGSAQSSLRRCSTRSAHQARARASDGNRSCSACTLRPSHNPPPDQEGECTKSTHFSASTVRVRSGRG